MLTPTDLVQQLLPLRWPYVVITVGIPGSGKTTAMTAIAKKLNVLRISPDDIRAEITGNAADQSVNAQVWAEAHRRMEEAITSGLSCILDATNVEVHFRINIAKMCRQFGATATVAVVFNTPLEIAHERNAARDRVLPGRVLNRMHAALQENPLTCNEGFDAIFVTD